MRVHDLKPAPGAHRKRKRVGRGPSGKGNKTAGRGIKGQKSRNNGPYVGFEGGQMPIYRRLPKFGGFTNRNRVAYEVVNVARLQEAFEAGAEVTPEVLAQRGFVGKRAKVKILGQGDIAKSMTVKAHAFSKQASSKIEAAGGTTEVV